MTYTFENLSYADFEDLARDLIGRELGVRFEAFTAGPDGGIDGRHAKGKSATILQAKHYAGSTIANLIAAIAKSRVQIKRLKPKRYIVATSKGLSPLNKAKLRNTLGAILKREDDIFGREDLNGLLRKFPDIERSNIKLWLSSAAVLDRVLRAASYSHTQFSREEIEAKVNVYAQNPSFKGAQEKLESEHVVIISGPPGVGKTTLAEMLSYAYLAEKWEYVAIRSLDDGLASIRDTTKQIFFFDDFLGTAALDARALAAKDSDLARFIKRVRKSPNARFVLTTRAPIFEEARRVSEHLADKKLDVTRYVLDVGVYTRRIRARILYNHLLVSGISRRYIKALWDADVLSDIIDHPNYNPRIIEAMTDGIQVRHLKPSGYARAFLNALKNPHQIWDVSFRNHIPLKCRHLIICLFFCSEYGVEIDDLRAIFNVVHPALSKKYGNQFAANDFEEALKIAEGGFVEIKDKSVSFINPSLRDYLINYLDNVVLLRDLARVAPRADWAREIWRHVKDTLDLSRDEIVSVAFSFRVVIKNFSHPGALKRKPGQPEYFRFSDISKAKRIELLLEWYDASSDLVFVRAALQTAQVRGDAFVSWWDGVPLVKMAAAVGRKGDDADDLEQELKSVLESALIEMLEGFVWPDDLESMLSEIHESQSELGEELIDAVRGAMVRQVRDIDGAMGSIDSESMLQDQINVLRRYAPQAGVSAVAIERAVSKIEDRIADINSAVEEASAPNVSASGLVEQEAFDDQALRDLFAPLLEGPQE